MKVRVIIVFLLGKEERERSYCLVGWLWERIRSGFIGEDF